MIIKRKNSEENTPNVQPKSVAPPLSDEQNQQVQKKTAIKKEVIPAQEIEMIDVSTVEFEERLERRRGDRRRGYRRIDERTLVSRAQEEAHSIRELAAREGYKNGLNEANKEITNIKTSLENFLAMRTQVYDDLSKDILELAIEVTKKIIKKEVELSEGVLKNIIESVFDEISVNEQKVTIKVAPDEVDFARASMPEILSNSQIDAKIVVIPDENIEKGSCTVYTNNGVIDANFSTQLEIVQNAFGIYKGGQ